MYARSRLSLIIVKRFCDLGHFIKVVQGIKLDGLASVKATVIFVAFHDSTANR
jgi:hypothetical protein